MEDAFGVKCFVKDGEKRDFIRPRSIKPMEKLTGEFPEYVDFEKIKKENPEFDDIENETNNSNVSFKGLTAINSIKNITSNKDLNNVTKVFVG